MKKHTYLIVGGGGFIAGHLIKRLLEDGNNVIAADIKPEEYWFQTFNKVKNYSDMDMKDYSNCLKVTKDVDYIFNMACNMGGMGFIENNKAECMLSVLINTNLLRACVQNNVKKYFFSSTACVYNMSKQDDVFVEALKEDEHVYPAMPEDGYGWEKLFSERMCRHFMEDFGLEVRVARYHNVYGPLGTYDGGREKAPAAICRKIASSVINNNDEIEIWGDGKQTRSFLFIEDCIEGTIRLFNSNRSEPTNIGSDEQVSINQMTDIIEKISGIKQLKRKYLLDKPKGVRGRSSNNEIAIRALNWKYSISLEEGLKKTYQWIFSELKKDKSNTNKFCLAKLS
jgi:GDP-D-mannose 3',5'-epimerase